ncbi:MAG: M28 family peptidase, partial [Planctomycetota bacterium]
MRTASFRLGLIAAGLTGLGLLTGAALPEDEGDGDTWLGEDPVTDVLVELGPEVQTFHRHMSFLASEYLKGRLPGTPEMEIARDYCAEHLELAGLQPAFPVEGSDELSFYQPFELRPTSKLVGQSLAIAGSGERFEAEVDYQALSLGSGGSVTADAAFVGYSINRAPATSGYESYPDETDLTGQIAVMLRFEPMDEDGNSLWTDEGRGPWTARASLRGKVRAAERRGAAGVIVINPPGANDPRIDALNAFGSGGAVGEFPVLHVSTAAGERLVRAAGTTLMDLRRRADAAGVVEPLGIQLEVTSDVAYEPVLAANVGGLLPGKGDLADQYVVVGAHLDHLGMGNFGSRDNEFRGIKVHPGADDNASGSVGVLMLADRLAREYAALGESAHARSIVFVLFDAEESGLNGASHYVDNPVAPLVQHSLMMNFDMIGRIEDDLLSVTGHDTGTGLKGIVMPLYEASPLQVESGSRGPGGS